MLSNKVRRNIWLTLAVVSAVCVVDRAVRVIDGSVEWWNLVSAIIITVLCVKFYLCYRRKVNNGNLCGRTDVFE